MVQPTEHLPVHVPASLGRSPGAATFWVLAAPIIFPGVGAVIFPVLLAPLGGDSDSLRMFWTVTVLAGAAQLVGVILWARHMGAGPFAGPLRARPKWLAAAVLLGPLLLFIPTLIANQVMAGDPAWQYSGDIDPYIFARANWIPAFLLYVLLLAPVLEEVTFRGIALGGLMARGASPGLAVILSSLAFALVHLQYNLTAMAVVFCAGLGFAVLRLASGSMLVSVLAHISANAGALLLGSLSSLS